MILIDEWVAYLRQIYKVEGLPSGSFDSNLSFVQSLTEAVKASPGTLLVASLPASQIEVGGEGGQEALSRLKQTFSRVETGWRPADQEESHEIVRRRLFKEIPGDKFHHRDNTLKQFAKMYRDSPNEFPQNCEGGREILRRIGCPRCHEAMQRLGPDVGIPPEHLPVLVPGHQCNLFDGQADLEQTTGAFVPEVVEVKVLDVSIGTGAAERRADRSGVVGEDWTLRLSERLGLRHDEGPDIKSGGGEERDPLVVASLVARVLAVADQEYPAVDV